MSEKRDFWTKVIILTGLLGALATFSSTVRDTVVSLLSLIPDDKTAQQQMPTPPTPAPEEDAPGPAQAEPTIPAVGTPEMGVPPLPDIELNINTRDHTTRLVGKVKGKPGYCVYQKDDNRFVAKC